MQIVQNWLLLMSTVFAKQLGHGLLIMVNGKTQGGARTGMSVYISTLGDKQLNPSGPRGGCRVERLSGS